MPLIKNPDFIASSPEPTQSAAVDLRTLATGSSEQRWRAARRLSRLPQAVGQMAAILATEYDDRVREAILTGLVALNVPAAVEAILPLLRAENAAVRTAALDALRAMPATGRYITTLLQDADADIRILACEIARDLPSPPTVGALSNILEADPMPNVCAAAIDTLAEIGGAAQVGAIQHCLVRFPTDPFLAFAVKIASARLVSAL